MDITQITKHANPAPLGLFGFGVTTLMLALIKTKLVENAFIVQVVSLGLFYGGFAQLLAGLLEFVVGNTFGFVAFCSYGSFWLVFSMAQLFAKLYSLPSAAEFLVGETVYLSIWGLITLGFTVTTLRKNHASMVVFSTLTLTFFVLAGGVWNGVAERVGGYLALVCSISALYTGFGNLYQDHMGITIPGMKKINYI